LERFGGANQQSILLQGLSWREVPERINDVRFGDNPDGICSLRAFPLLTRSGRWAHRFRTKVAHRDVLFSTQ
jgi:hypothetical protein